MNELNFGKMLSEDLIVKDNGDIILVGVDGIELKIGRVS